MIIKMEGASDLCSRVRSARADDVDFLSKLSPLVSLTTLECPCSAFIIRFEVRELHLDDTPTVSIISTFALQSFYRSFLLCYCCYTQLFSPPSTTKAGISVSSSSFLGYILVRGCGNSHSGSWWLCRGGQLLR